MNILVIRFSSMGDVILTAPLLTYLKNKDPEVEITLITGSKYADLFRDDPRLVSVVPYFRDDEQKIFSNLALEKWDLVIDLQNNLRSNRIRKKYFPSIAYGVFNKLHLKRLLLLLLHLNFYGTHSSVAERYILASGISSISKKDIPPVKLYCNDDKAHEHEIFQDNNAEVIALFPFSSWKNKQWPAASYVEVGRHFSKHNWRVALFGGPEDVAAAEKLKNEIGGSCYSFAGSLSLYEIGCLLKQCTLALGGDTGLSHLARACGVKTGVIYGATSHHFGFFPYGDPPYKIFESEQFCRPCHPHGGNICLRVSRPCLGMTKENEVIAGLEDVLKR